MIRSIVILSAAAVCGASASAQSSVSVSGFVNTSIENQKGADGARSTQMLNNGSRIGLRGSEDLGGGVKAGFWLVQGFNADNGTLENPGVFWNRRSEVNLSTPYGTLRLGNMPSEAYFASADYVSLHNGDNGNSADALYAYLGRNRDKVAYRSPVMGGLTVDAAVALREQLANARHSVDLAANYAIGPLQWGVGYEKNGDANQTAIRALYEWGSFVVGGYVQRDQNGFGPGLGHRTAVRLSGMYMTGPSEFHVNWGRTGDYSRLEHSAARQLTLAYNHNLSKRTKLYVLYTRLNDGLASLYGGDRTSVGAGMQHRF